MKGLKYLVLAAAFAFALVAAADAQEKGCEYEGKKYENGEQLWDKDGTEKCWICDDGTWTQGFRHIERYCKGKA